LGVVVFPWGTDELPATLVKVIAARSPLLARRNAMSYRIAGIDVHKKMLAVVVSDVEIESEYSV
jgi:hypothetical protein